jgi:hypothetical protein
MEERGQGNSNDGRKAPPALVDVRNELNCKVKIEKMKGNEKSRRRVEHKRCAGWHSEE